MNNDVAAELSGYKKHYDFTQYSHDNNVNVIPEEDFKHLVEETFKCIADILRNTYGPYASSVVISEQSETFATKDGYNVFNAVGFSHTYKRMIYLAIKKIIDRVNNNVGDGTTSCILLAEKMFREIEKTIKTVDDKRNILSVLTNIERVSLNRAKLTKDMDESVVHPLTQQALCGLIDMAGNYDESLTDVIMAALHPEIDENGNIINIRNVVVDDKLDRDVDATTFEVDYLPGDYRIRVNMDVEFALSYEDPRKVRVAVYDHAFGASDWNFFMDQFDKETETLIIARAFNRSFMDCEYTRYLKERAMVKRPVKIVLAEIKGEFVRDEIKDLAAVLKTEPIGLHAQAVDHESLPFVPVQVYKRNCMCFNMDEIPQEYIDALKLEMEADLSGSLIKHQVYKDRIRALSKTSNDTLITVKSPTSLELKMTADKIDDCISIVNSAMEYGVVPNLFAYGYWRMMNYKHSVADDSMEKDVAAAIMTSIRGLFDDIWASKHGENQLEKRDAIATEIYKSPDSSFDILREAYVDIANLPTSAQYDLEVIAAAISIVKYLITSRAFIFDAHIMKQVDDTGSYMPLGN